MIFRVVFSLVILCFSCQLAFAEMLSVKGSSVNLRAEPTSSAAIKWEYGKGFPVKILQKKGEWLKVTDFEQDSGWIHSSLLTDTPHVIVRVNKNSTKNINIRKGPSTKEPIVGKAFYGVVFQKLDKRQDWVKVRHESGLEGWISAGLLWGL